MTSPLSTTPNKTETASVLCFQCGGTSVEIERYPDDHPEWPGQGRRARCLTCDPPDLPITIFTPAALYNEGDPSKGFTPKTVGTPGTVTWLQLCCLLSRAHEGNPAKYPDPNIAKSARGGWAACSLRGGRRLSTALITTRLLGLDIDHGGDISRVLEAFAPFKKVIHSTYKSNASDPRCRVIFPLAEPCTDIDLFRRAHKGLREVAVLRGHFESSAFDDAGSDPTRLWFLPMVPPGGVFEFRMTDGALLNLSRVATLPPTPKRTTKKGTQDAKGALAWAARRQASADEGHRHVSAFSLAAWLAEIEPEIDERDIEAALLPHAPSGRETEFRRTIRDAVSKARGQQ